MSKNNLSKEKESLKDEIFIKNKNRVEKKIEPFQSEYDRLQVKPSEAGVSLLPAKKKPPTRSSDLSENSNSTSFVISRGKIEQTGKNTPSNYNSNIDAGAFPFNKKLNPSMQPQEMWATLDGEASWSAHDNSNYVLEEQTPDKVIDNNEYVIIESEENDYNVNKNNFNDSDHYQNDITEVGNYTLMVKNSLVLTNATESEIQNLIEKIIYGDYEEFKDEDLKASDFCVYKRVDLYFGVSILG